MIQPPHYSIDIDVIQHEARNLVRRKIISPRQPIYTLSKYIPASEWMYVERELEENEFLLRDSIADLISNQEWEND